ncbi:MAG: hypothetical protein ABIR06_20575 [Cyclobacteriaceae bacterium]
MKILNAKLHGIIDYLVVIFLMLAPTLFGLSDFISKFTFLLGAVHLALTALTNFRYGLFKIIPFKAHGVIELIVAIVLMASPLILGSYTETSLDKFFLAGFGVAVLITWAITDYSTSGTN